MIFDVDGQKLYSFDSKKKEADVWDMQAFGGEMTKSVDTSEMKASRQAERQDQGDRRQDRRPATTWRSPCRPRWAAEEGMKMTVMLTGPMWIVKGAPGTADYIAFYKGAVEKGWIFSDPRAAKGSPGQARGDGRNVQAAGRHRRRALRNRDEHQDGGRRPDGRR